MKINRIQLGEALLTITLAQFQDVPSETEIQHTFSQSFQEKIRRITQNSKSTMWRIWQAPVKRGILIAILIMVILLAAACATPLIRNTIIEFFIKDDQTALGVTFAPTQVSGAPDIIEDYYIPTFDHDEYPLVLRDITQSSVEYVWQNEHNEYIHYCQTVIQEDLTESTWFAVDAEGTGRFTKNLNGYAVEIISDKASQQYMAVWTDNRYLYTLDISVKGSDQEAILKTIMSSLKEAESIS